MIVYCIIKKFLIFLKNIESKISESSEKNRKIGSYLFLSNNSGHRLSILLQISP